MSNNYKYLLVEDLKKDSFWLKILSQRSKKYIGIKNATKSKIIYISKNSQGYIINKLDIAGKKINILPYTSREVGRMMGWDYCISVISHEGL